MDHRRFFFLDETSLNTHFTRTCGRVQGSERLVCSAPQGGWRSTTLLAAMGLDGIVAPMVFDGAVDKPLFLAWLGRFLAPELAPGDVVVMDNLSSHKGEAVEAAVRAAGGSVLYTPPFSPDMNPIEMFFSKLKAHLRRIEARTREALDRAVVEVIEMLTPAEVEGFFRHCGYDSL